MFHDYFYNPKIFAYEIFIHRRLLLLILPTKLNKNYTVSKKSAQNMKKLVYVLKICNNLHAVQIKNTKFAIKKQPA